MSVYNCGICAETIDADFMGCNENPFDEMSCICDGCEEAISCYGCGEVKTGQQFCKITDQYYCPNCGG